MPSHLPPCRPDQSRVPSLRRVVLHAFFGTTNPSDFLPAPFTFNLPALCARSLPDAAAGEDLSCSAIFFGNVPPPTTPERSSTPSGLAEYCLLPSPRYDRLGPFKHLSAENMTWLQRSLNVAARFLAPLSFNSRAFDTPLRTVGFLLPPGVCYRALRRLPGRDFHARENRVFQDAPQVHFTVSSGCSYFRREMTR